VCTEELTNDDLMSMRISRKCDFLGWAMNFFSWSWGTSTLRVAVHKKLARGVYVPQKELLVKKEWLHLCSSSAKNYCKPSRKCTLCKTLAAYFLGSEIYWLRNALFVVCISNIGTATHKIIFGNDSLWHNSGRASNKWSESQTRLVCVSIYVATRKEILTQCILTT